MMPSGRRNAQPEGLTIRRGEFGPTLHRQHLFYHCPDDLHALLSCDLDVLSDREMRYGEAQWKLMYIENFSLV
jgi:hypothetical protein